MFVDMVDSEEVLKAVQARGPMIPMEIRKFLGKGDSITIGAALSSLSSKGIVKFTHVKIGGSPFYYVKGQENKLELLNKYLNDKDKRTFDELRQSRILKDSSQEPLVRVSLRNISDFAKKVELTSNDESVLFWRWYMVGEEEAINIIRGDSQRKELSHQPNASQQSQINEENSGKQLMGDAVEQSRSFPVDNSEKEQREKKLENYEGEEKHKSFEKPIRQNSKNEEQKTFHEEVPDFDDSFFKKIKKFFDENNISLKQAKLIRKGSDYEFVVSMKSPFGETDYFCKAKSKKKCNEGDLSSAYLQGQNKRLPTVFLTTGEITKKAKTTAREEYKGLLIKEL